MRQWIKGGALEQDGNLRRESLFAEGSRYELYATSLDIRDDNIRQRLEHFLYASYEAQRTGGEFWNGPLPIVLGGERGVATRFIFTGADDRGHPQSSRSPSRMAPLPEKNLFARLPGVAVIFGDYFSRIAVYNCKEVPQDWLKALCKKPDENENCDSGEVRFVGDPLDVVKGLEETSIEFWKVDDATKWVREMTRKRYRCRLKERGISEKDRKTILKKIDPIVDKIDLKAGNQPIRERYGELDKRVDEEDSKIRGARSGLWVALIFGIVVFLMVLMFWLAARPG